MDSAAMHVAQYLVSVGLVTIPTVPQPGIRLRAPDDMVLNSNDGWQCFVGTRPPEPNNAVTVYDTGGTQANADGPLYDSTIQVSVRAVEYFPGYSLAMAIRDALMIPTAREIDGWHYTGFWLISDVAKIGRDDNNRELFTVNFRTMRQRAA